MGGERVAFGGLCERHAAAGGAGAAKRAGAEGPGRSACAAEIVQARAHAAESLPRRLLPAAARRWPLVPGGTLAVRPRPETRSRVDVKRGMAYGPRMSDDLAWLDASAQAELVRRGKASPAELVEAAIRRIERTNPELNAVIIPRFEKARAEAASRALPDGPFRGVPFLLKDLICYSAGDPHHMGTRFLRDLGFVAPADTYLAEKFRAAGFVFLGKTNTPELGTLPTTEPEAYGPSRNPWDTSRSTGGSSGGSAAAVAEGAARLLTSLGHTVEASHPEALDDLESARHFTTMYATGMTHLLDVLGHIVGRKLGPEDVDALNWGLAEMGRCPAEEYLAAREWIARYTRRVASWWAGGFDLLLTPTLTAPPPPLGSFVPDARDPVTVGIRASQLAAFTSPFNLTGQPAISLPLHWGTDGLPIGVQLVAAYGREDLLIRVAAELEAARPWAARRPPVHA